MKQSVTRFAQFALAVAVLVLVGMNPSPVWAQQADGRSANQRFEIEFHGGFHLPQRLNFRGACNPTNEDGCTADEFEFDGDETTAPFFASAGNGLTVNSGAQVGFRVGVDLDPRWQVEFSFDHVLSHLAFENEGLRIASVFDEIDATGVPDPGDPKGSLNIYQVNLNYHTRETGRVIPYFGGGAGVAQFRNPPTLRSTSDFDESEIASLPLGEDTAFAINFGGGVKIFPSTSERWGIRLEARNLISFYNATHKIHTLDVDDTPPSVEDEAPNANFDQKSTFQHLMLTVGLFFRF